MISELIIQVYIMQWLGHPNNSKYVNKCIRIVVFTPVSSLFARDLALYV